MSDLQSKIKIIEEELSKENFEEAKIKIRNLLKKYSKLPYLYFLHGIILDRENEFEYTKIAYKKAIKLQPDFIDAHYNLASLFYRNRLAKEAIIHYKKTIELKPDFVQAYLDLGSAFKYLKNFDEAIHYYRKALELNPNLEGGYIRLGGALQDNGQYKEAIPYLKRYGVASKARALECMYAIKDFAEYNNYLAELSETNPINLRAATISAYASNQLNIKNIYPFCKNPLEHIYTINIKSYLKPLNTSDFTKEILNFKDFWEESGAVTVGAFKTPGNIFDYKSKCILKLKQIILNQLKKYKEKFSKSEDFIITRWPKLFKLYGWHVRYLKKGMQKHHIHPDGWISGSFYIKMPKNISNNEGAIQFNIRGFNYPVHNKEKKIPNFEYVPKNGDLVLFPSSLFHNTVPYSSDEQRQMIAFDIRPQ